MTSKLTITRERLSGIARGEHCYTHDDVIELARAQLAAMDSEPVAWVSQSNLDALSRGHDALVKSTDNVVQPVPLYRHAQPAPVVPDDVLVALQKVARIRLDLNDFDGDRRGIADCLGDAEEALIEVVNRRAAMLNGGKS